MVFWGNCFRCLFSLFRNCHATKMTLPLSNYAPNNLYELSLRAVCARLPPLEMLKCLPNSLKCNILNKCSKRGQINYEILETLLNGKVSKLELSDCDVTDKDLELCTLAPNLYKLNLNSLKGFRTSITATGLTSVAENCPNLKDLSLRRCSTIQDLGILQIANKCKYLTTLNLASCDNLTDLTLYAIADNSKFLQSLDISRNANYSDLGVTKLAENLCESLREISITKCAKLTDDSIYALTTFCEKLEILSFAGCVLMTSGAHELINNFFSDKQCKLLSFTIDLWIILLEWIVVLNRNRNLECKTFLRTLGWEKIRQALKEIVFGKNMFVASAVLLSQEVNKYGLVFINETRLRFQMLARS